MDSVGNCMTVAVRAPVGNIGANLVRQAAAKTNDLAGNGTTTSVLLAQGLIAEGTVIREEVGLTSDKADDVLGQVAKVVLTRMQPQLSGMEVRKKQLISVYHKLETSSRTRL